jgi:hypothetical protein
MLLTKHGKLASVAAAARHGGLSLQQVAAGCTIAGCSQALRCCCQPQSSHLVCPGLLQLVGREVHHVSCDEATGLCSHWQLHMGLCLAACHHPNRQLATLTVKLDSAGKVPGPHTALPTLLLLGGAPL